MADLATGYEGLYWRSDWEVEIATVPDTIPITENFEFLVEDSLAAVNFDTVIEQPTIKMLEVRLSSVLATYVARQSGTILTTDDLVRLPMAPLVDTMVDVQVDSTL